MSRWLGYMGLPIAVGMFLYPLSLLNVNPNNVFTLLYFFAYLAGQVWLLAGAIFMLRLREEPMLRTRQAAGSSRARRRSALTVTSSHRQFGARSAA